MKSNKTRSKSVPRSPSNVFSAYPNVNANWLLTGEGEMLLNNNEVGEPDERKQYTPDRRKRIERVEAFLKGKFKDFEEVD